MQFGLNKPANCGLAIKRRGHVCKFSRFTWDVNVPKVLREAV